MKDFVLYLVKSIVDQPEMVKIQEEESAEQMTIKLTVAKEDMGKVIGRSGKIIKAIRNLIRIKAIKEEKRVNLELVESE